MSQKLTIEPAAHKTSQPRPPNRNPHAPNYYSIPRGELLFFKHPKNILQVTITTDDDTYMPGDLVTFEVTVTNPNAP
jgi:hypothetical protein